jgi:integrase
MKHPTQGVRPGVPIIENGGIDHARGINRLTDRTCKVAQPGPGPAARKLFDGLGMYLLVQPNGAKLWRVKYRHGGSERLYAIGQYPEVTLVEAREERKRARAWVKEGKDPVKQRELERAGHAAKGANTFEAVARKFIAKQSEEWSTEHRKAVEHRLKHQLLDDLGPLPIGDITPPVVLATLKKIEARGALETASKSRILAKQIFDFAIAAGHVQLNVAGNLAGALKKRKPIHRATIPNADMPKLFAAVARVSAEANTRLAFCWLILTATRTSETRFATWQEIEDGNLWRIPAERMKMVVEHLVPLSTQAIQILKRAESLRQTNNGEALIFPGFSKTGHLSENALLALLARAGYPGKQTAHGFRSSFSTWAHEKAEANPDIVEACLAHGKEGVRGIYNRATYLSQRLALLQAWGDQLVTWGMQL